MKLDKIKDIIAVVAPTIGTALGGPLGGLAGTVLASILGTSDPKAIEKMVASQDPAILLKLKEAEQQFLLKMEELDISRDQLEVQDRTSARELAQVNMTPHIWLSAGFLFAYGLVLLALVTGEATIPEAYKELVMALIGIMSASVTQILGFWFGSSHGSAVKTALNQAKGG